MIETLADDSGVLLRAELLAAGFDDKWIRRQRRVGLLVRIRQGAYVLAHVWERADPVGRHLLLVRAVLRQYGDGVAASHTSAVLLHGGPAWRLPLGAVTSPTWTAPSSATERWYVTTAGTVGPGISRASTRAG